MSLSGVLAMLLALVGVFRTVVEFLWREVRVENPVRILGECLYSFLVVTCPCLVMWRTTMHTSKLSSWSGVSPVAFLLSKMEKFFEV